MMKIAASRATLKDIEEDALIVPVFTGDTPREGLLAELDDFTNHALSQAYDTGEIDGKKDRWAVLYTRGRERARRVLVYGAGDRKDAGALELNRMAGAAIRIITERNAASAAFLLRGFEGDGARAIVEGAVLGSMDGNLYQSDRDDRRNLERFTVISGPEGPDVSCPVSIGAVMAEATNFARTLAYEPGNIMTPTELARRAREMAAREGLKGETLVEEELKEMGMGALLAISKGSAEPATLTVLDYTPEIDSPEVIGLVGKGVTFDSGGISIKPAHNMEDMKYDMGGGAAVIGAMMALARLRPPIRVMGFIPAAENLPSGRAVKPGDVVRSLSGKTIEVVNTDAEGRLLLADAIAYAIGRGVTHVVDAATLTGACAIALGEVRAAVVGSNQELIDELIQAGERCGERLWQLPFDSEYAELVQSDIADVKNVGDRTAGAITAAAFINHFVGSLPWAHLDIAGTAWLDEAKPYMARGATGFGVRVLANFVLNRAERNVKRA